MGPGGPEFKDNLADKEFQERFWNAATELFADGRLIVHSKDVRQGGLQGILGGLDELRNGKVSGKKLVYQIGE